MRILAKNSVINKLSIPMTISRFNNTFLIVCVDDIHTINFYDNVSLFRHSSFLSFIKGFNFSDAYVCFFDSYKFIDLLKIYSAHVKTTPSDGTNLVIGYVFNGIFINIFNFNLIERIIFRDNYVLDLENFFIQIIAVIIKFIEVFVFYNIDRLLLTIENNIFDI